VCSSDLAEMHLGVDHPRQDVQTAAVDDLARRGRRQIADRRNRPAGDADVAHAFAVVVDDGAALQDEVVSVGHVGDGERRRRSLWRV